MLLTPKWLSHESQLQELWSLYQPLIEYPGQKHNLWKTIGFQGDNPMTDFRGLGSLSIKCLIYMGKTRPGLTKRLILNQREYPLCCAAINILNMLCNLLGMTSTQLKRPLLQHYLFQVFCRQDVKKVISTEGLLTAQEPPK